MTDDSFLDGGLLVAVCVGNVDRASRILMKGIKANASPGCKTYLHAAAQFRQASCCRLLIEHGANVQAKDKKGRSALHVAAFHGSPACCLELIPAGVNVKDKLGRAALHSGVSRGNQKCCKLLIEHEANVNLSDHKGWAPLHAAASQGQTGCCILLLQNGANINAQTNRGQSCLAIAKANGHENTFQALREYAVSTSADELVSRWRLPTNMDPEDDVSQLSGFYLAHPGEHKNVAIVVAKLLRARGKRVFLDALEMRKDKDQAIYSAIASHDCFVALTSDLFDSREWCQRELGAAQFLQTLRDPKHRRQIICLRLGDKIEHGRYAGTSASGDIAARIIEFFDRFMIKTPLDQTERKSIPLWLEQFHDARDRVKVPLNQIQAFVGTTVY